MENNINILNEERKSIAYENRDLNKLQTNYIKYKFLKKKRILRNKE